MEPVGSACSQVYQGREVETRKDVESNYSLNGSDPLLLLYVLCLLNMSMMDYGSP